MLPAVEEDVRKRTAHLRRVRESSPVISITEHAAAPGARSSASTIDVVAAEVRLAVAKGIRVIQYSPARSARGFGPHSYCS